MRRCSRCPTCTAVASLRLAEPGTFTGCPVLLSGHSPAELRRRQSMRSFNCESVTEETLPASGHGYAGAGSWPEPAGTCPPTCSAVEPHDLPPDIQAKVCLQSQLYFFLRLAMMLESSPECWECLIIASEDASRRWRAVRR